jgi:hypothetical protein
MKRLSSTWLGLVLLFVARIRALKVPSQVHIAEKGQFSERNIRHHADLSI